MFQKLLIANRGEIACRVIRTAKRLGISTVAVYSDADAGSLSVELADEAVHIGGSTPAESYLRAEAILDAARATGADAVHPGYGFLAENAAFARACKAAGVCFVGPSAEAIEAMGLKDAALDRMRSADVPILPGFRDATANDEALSRAVEELGFPLLIKPSAGGGGKGMRVLRDGNQLSETLAASRREAAGAFGNDTLMLERYLERPRHIEVQLFADTHGHAIYLLDRDCSIQRRYQKVIEEAPAPGLHDDLRRKMGNAAVAAARAIDYVGAGTVEFLLDNTGDADAQFYFMEMNTRLQVEHPVTEMVLGVDLVEWQLRIASGEPLPLEQSQVSPNGHAMEARLYAEDPRRDFLPASGRLARLSLPANQNGIRIDSGVREGDTVSIHYDPMIAKLIAHGGSREHARQRLLAALDDAMVVGLPTNLSLLRDLAAHPGFAAAELSTKFISEQASSLVLSPTQFEDGLLLAALWQILSWEQGRENTAQTSPEPNSPWDSLHGWRMNMPRCERVRMSDEDHNNIDLLAYGRADGFEITVPSGRVEHVSGTLSAKHLSARIGGRRRDARVAHSNGELVIVNGGKRTRWFMHDPNQRADAEHSSGQGELTAPMPGKVIEVLIAKGDRVAEGDTLLLLEAMKMEHRIRAPFAGIVDDLHYGAGDLVDEGAELVSLSSEEASPT